MMRDAMGSRGNDLPPARRLKFQITKGRIDTIGDCNFCEDPCDPIFQLDGNRCSVRLCFTCMGRVRDQKLSD